MNSKTIVFDDKISWMFLSIRKANHIDGQQKGTRSAFVG